MKLKALRDFVTVVERNGVRAAARHLGVAQPAVSRSIQDLEKELGVALFERHVKGLRLTAMGQAFLRRATAVGQELQRARDEIAQLRGEVHGRVTLCMSTAPHLSLLPQVLRGFRQQYPDVHMEVIDAVYPLVETALLHATADVYVGPVPREVPGELQVEKLFDNTRVIVARKGHPLAHATRLRDLVEAEWITTSITHKAEEELAPLFSRHGLPAPRLMMRAQSALTFLTALAGSDLLMMLPIQWLQTQMFKDAFEEIRVLEPLPAPPICLVWRTGLPLTPAAEFFCTLIRRAAAHVVVR